MSCFLPLPVRWMSSSLVFGHSFPWEKPQKRLCVRWKYTPSSHIRSFRNHAMIAALFQVVVVDRSCHLASPSEAHVFQISFSASLQIRASGQRMMSEPGFYGHHANALWVPFRWNTFTWKVPFWSLWRKKNSVRGLRTEATLFTPSWTFGVRLGISVRRRPWRLKRHLQFRLCRPSKLTNPVPIWAICWLAGSTPRRIFNNHNSNLPCCQLVNIYWACPVRAPLLLDVALFLRTQTTHIPAQKTWHLKVNSISNFFFKERNFDH